MSPTSCWIVLLVSVRSVNMVRKFLTINCSGKNLCWVRDSRSANKETTLLLYGPRKLMKNTKHRILSWSYEFSPHPSTLRSFLWWKCVLDRRSWIYCSHIKQADSFEESQRKFWTSVAVDLQHRKVETVEKSAGWHALCRKQFYCTVTGDIFEMTA